MMEIFQLQTKSWFLPRQLFLEDPTLSSLQDPVFCHILSGAMAKQHRTRLNLMSYHNNLEIYKWRFKKTERIVPIYNIQMLQAVRTQATVSILCEKVFFQMEEIFDKLTISEQLYLFIEVLQALKELQEVSKYARLTAKMIGVNKGGKCKIWINDNHGSNEVQYPCASFQESYEGLFELFNHFASVNAIFRLFMEEMAYLEKNYSNIKQYTQNFMAERFIRTANAINMNNLIKMIEKEGSNKWSELNCRPSFTFKRGKESTEVTYSRQQSQKSKDSILHSQVSLYNFSQGPKFSLKGSQKTSKTKTLNDLKKSNKRMLSHLETKNKVQKIQESEASPAHSLGICSRLQESIIIESDIFEQKSPSFDINELQKLGRIGKFCESMMAEELILEEFKDIYG